MTKTSIFRISTDLVKERGQAYLDDCKKAMVVIHQYLSDEDSVMIYIHKDERDSVEGGSVFAVLVKDIPETFDKILSELKDLLN